MQLESIGLAKNQPTNTTAGATMEIYGNLRAPLTDTQHLGYIFERTLSKLYS